MKQRILVAVVGIPALLAVLCIAPAWATALLLAALSVIAAHELLTAVSGPDKARRWTVLPALCGVLLLGQMLEAAKSALDVLPAFAQQSGVDAELTKFLLRVTGIALTCELAAQLCRDAGSGGLAQKVELGGKVVILCACLPLVRELSACALSLLD